MEAIKENPALDMNNLEDLADHAKALTISLTDTWEQSLYPAFLKEATRKEVLTSQEPFFKAVEAFPVMLLNLAAMIPTSAARLNLIENFWEEHGQGDSDKFHTESFKTHLKALGYNGKSQLRWNPYVDDWIREIYEIQDSEILFNTLAAIEYIYALISNTIGQHLASMDLLCEQTHYTTHSELDWEHGAEILEAMLLNGDKFDSKLFTRVQKEFIQLFNRLVVPTQKEIDRISNIPVAFYYTREDQGVLDEALSKIDAVNLDIMTVCSGGEHVMHYLTKYKVASIHAIDMNLNQIEVCKRKIDMATKGVLLLEEKEGKFEALFAMVRNYLRDEEGKLNGDYIKDEHLYNEDKLHYLMEMIFSRKILNQVFTDDATKYSSQSFSDHFYQVFDEMINNAYIEHDRGCKNSYNVILSKPIPSKTPLMKDGELQHDLTYEQVNVKELEFTKKYDIIDLSNIGDWMPQEEFNALVEKAMANLESYGKLILRRLLGDYRLTDLQDKYQVQVLQDSTGFYSETVLVSHNEV